MRDRASLRSASAAAARSIQRNTAPAPVENGALCGEARARASAGASADAGARADAGALEQSLVRGVGRDDEGSSQGIAVERRRLGNLPADIEIAESVVSGTAEMGVWLDDATATIEDTTIVDIGGAADGARELDASGLGNGVRVRRNRERDDSEVEPDVRIVRSYIDGAHESSVHAEGAWVELEQSLVGAALAEPLAARFGDSVAAYGYPWSPARLGVTESLVRRGARTALASFDAAVTFKDAVVDARDATACTGSACAAPLHISGGAPPLAKPLRGRFWSRRHACTSAMGSLPCPACREFPRTPHAICC